MVRSPMPPKTLDDEIVAIDYAISTLEAELKRGPLRQSATSRSVK